jgi:hypothetical protein
VTDSALISVSLDVGLNTIALVAKRTITVDAVMTGLAGERSGQRCEIVEGFVDWYKSVAGVDEVGIGDARCTEVPIRAVEALVTDTIDVLFVCLAMIPQEVGEYTTYLITPITDSVVTNVTAWSEQSLSDEVKLRILNSRLECMLGVVTMLHANMASDAEIKVGAAGAGDKVLLGEF